MQGIRLGAPLIFEDEYIFDKSVLIPKIEMYAENTNSFYYDNPIEIGNAGSTAFEWNSQPHTWPELQGFIQWLGPVASQILQSWEFDFTDIVIINSWVNRHRKGGWTNFHVHHGAHLTLAAYIQADENSGDLIIEDPLDIHWMGYPAIKQSRKDGGYKLPILDNKVYLFSPFLRHATEPSRSDQDRWVLSINLQTLKENIE